MDKVFRTITDSELKPRNGQQIDVLGPVDPAKYDFADVGPMSHIRFPDGVEVEAFNDEILQRAAVVVADEHSNHNLPVGAEVEFLKHEDGADWWTQGGDDDEVAIDPRDLKENT